MPAAAAHATSTASASRAELASRLTRHVQTMKRHRQVIRFFATHSWLLDDPRFSPEAQKQLAFHRRQLLRTATATARLREAQRRLERMLAIRRSRMPRTAICDVFGSYCAEALVVAHCESRFRTTARNGQYLGLFQMGATARQLYGHGESAGAQARAAFRYFVSSGRTWGPWSCKP